MISRTDLDHILDHTRDLWEDLRGARLFITGGTGFFGGWLLESLLYANQELDLKIHASVLTRDPDAVKRSRPHLVLNPVLTLLKGDVRYFEFPHGEYSHIIHAATEASVRKNEENPSLMLDTILEGTRHTLDFAVQCKAEKFLFTSSGAVYGKQPSDLTHIPEEYNGGPEPMDAKSAYGIGKKTGEYLCTLYAKQHGFQATIARCFAFVGPYLPLDIHFAIGNFIRDGLKGRTIIIQGDGTPYRSYLYAADLAIWLWTILLRGESLRPYNVGSDVEMTIEQVAQTVAMQFDPSPVVQVMRERAPGNPPERYVPSITRARRELGLEVWIPIKEGITRTILFEKQG